MSISIDSYCEARSSDESDAGSLEDFIAGSDEEGSDPLSITDGEELDVVNIIPTRKTGTLRRSTRTGKAPVRYVDDDYVRLMTEDVDTEAVVSSDNEEEGYDGEDYEELSDSESTSEEDSPRRLKKRRLSDE
jgi:hypothetical protein